MKNLKHRHHGFTLVELMVAMAVLIIMMGFLFQFVLGAQRVWSASEEKNDIFQTANIVLNVVETDLHNMQFSTEPGKTLPLYARINGNDVYLAFFSNYQSKNYNSSNAHAKELENVGTYPVFYYYNAAAKRLYRITLDTKTKMYASDSTEREIKNLWYLYGSNYADKSTNLASDFFTLFAVTILGINPTATPDINMMKNLEPYLLAENISSFKLDAALWPREDGETQTFNAKGTSPYQWYADAQPRLVRVQMTIEPPNRANRSPEESNAHQFAKIITIY